MDNAINLIKQKGTTLLEALVATAIIGVGFIAIFQMVIYSVRSIDDSGERTKINYLADMILEDLDAYKFSRTANDEVLFDALIDQDVFWQGTCAAATGIDTTSGNAEQIIVNKWTNRFSPRRLNDCRNIELENTQSLETFEICSTAVETCKNNNPTVFVKIYFGKLGIRTGERSKNLYFIIH